jgi:hypothetical protein
MPTVTLSNPNRISPVTTHHASTATDADGLRQKQLETTAEQQAVARRVSGGA